MSDLIERLEAATEGSRELDAKMLNNLLRYEPLTGLLFWLPRAPALFSEEWARHVWNKKYANEAALNTIDANGYRVGKIFGVTFKSHRIIWQMMFNEWPGEVDHINGNKGDNKLANLRDVSHVANCRNKKLSKQNTSGHTGVHRSTRDKKWIASIGTSSGRTHLGYFQTKTEAIAARKQRLELTWIGKNDRPRLEPRILLEEDEKSYHAKAHITDHDVFDNILIHGDNLLALKAIEQEFVGKVKCVFIDPPYNTGSAFEHYDDGVEHSLWLSLIRDRLEIIARLLSHDGSLWMTIDDNEAHYLKVLCDEIFGRANFVANAVWQKKYTVSNDAKWLAETHDHILIYARNKESWRPNRLERTPEMDNRYRNPDNHPKGPWKATPLYAKRTGSEKEQAFSFRFKNGVVWTPPRRGTSPRFPADALRAMDENDEIWFGADGTANPSRKTFLRELKLSEPPAPTVWLHSEAGNNHEAREEVKAINPNDAFATPKPEKLMKRIIGLATNPGDLVLDSFAGSGTTGAVAHKMGRRWIMVELGQHAITHIVPRLRKVVDGEDPGGVTEAVAWKGGGGFRFYRLAPSLLEKDAWGNWVISKDYDPAKVAQAVCKLMGFVYQPDETHYWMQGRSSETDFIYVTTQSLTHDQLAAISEEVGDERTLLVCCKAFHANADGFPNLTIKKIPQAVLRKCEWGKDDYSLNVTNLPEAPAEPDLEADSAPPSKAGRKRSNDTAIPQDDLFSQGESK